MLAIRGRSAPGGRGVGERGLRLPCHGELAVQLLIGATAVPGSVRRHVSAYERVWRGTGVMEPLHAREVQASSIVAGGTREGTIPAG